VPEIWFYHLERAGIEAVLPSLLEKSLERGWRTLVRTTSKERSSALEEALWIYSDESFLPHGRADDPDTELQPVLIASDDKPYDARELLILVDRAEAGEIADYQRVVLLFDGADEDALKDARSRWKRYKDDGLAVTYWQQSDAGKWEKKA
jgi:DNA polymerase-3 subunit chi